MGSMWHVIRLPQARHKTTLALPWRPIRGLLPVTHRWRFTDISLTGRRVRRSWGGQLLGGASEHLSCLSASSCFYQGLISDFLSANYIMSYLFTSLILQTAFLYYERHRFVSQLLVLVFLCATSGIPGESWSSVLFICCADEQQSCIIDTPTTEAPLFFNQVNDHKSFAGKTHVHYDAPLLIPAPHPFNSTLPAGRGCASAQKCFCSGSRIRKI